MLRLQMAIQKNVKAAEGRFILKLNVTKCCKTVIYVLNDCVTLKLKLFTCFLCLNVNILLY